MKHENWTPGSREWLMERDMKRLGATALDLSEIDDTKSDDHIALQVANIVLRKDVIRLAKESSEIRRLAGHAVKHRGHVAGDVALDKLAIYLSHGWHSPVAG
jgi:hypothetical protein